MPLRGEGTRRALGADGPHLHPVGFGAMALALQHRPPEDEAVRVMLAAVDAGVELVDTADAYCLDEGERGYGERLVRALVRLRPGVVVATKGGFTRPAGRWAVDASPAHLRRACEASLRALGTETLDLYQLHRPDARVPFHDSIGALAELRAAGKIRRVGLSNVTAEQLGQALSVLPIASVQNRLSPFDTGALRDGVLQLCKERGVAFLAYSPFGGLRRSTKIAAIPVLAAVAEAHGATPHQVALAWLMACTPQVMVIPSARSAARAAQNTAAAQLHLLPAELELLDRTLLPGASDSASGTESL